MNSTMVETIRRDGVLYLSLPGLVGYLSVNAEKLRGRCLNERSEDDGERVLELVVAELLACELTEGG